MTFFKNFNEVDLEFSSNLNCFLGPNGTGKTNLLDAIHYLSITKSATNNVDQQNVNWQENYFSIKGEFKKGKKTHKVVCAILPGQKKSFKVDGSDYEKLSEHIGLFPIVLVAPNDTDIIREGNEARRKYFDSVLSQIDQAYLAILIEYNQYLKQRNSLLKNFSESGKVDNDLLGTYDLQLIRLGTLIFEKRLAFSKDYLPIFIQHYEELTNGKEEVSIRYKSQYSDGEIERAYSNSVKKDIALQRTTVGIHRDGYDFEIKGNSLKKAGSQGQQKSFLISLKLTQFDIIKKEKGFKPILLLDDIFDKLDDHRISKLMEMVVEESFGQIFITDARPERTNKILEDAQLEASIFSLEENKVALKQNNSDQ